jgi:thymidylate kinase
MQHIINFTGMDGSGKTTALQRFATVMRNRGFAVLEVKSTYFDHTFFDFVTLFETETNCNDHVLERFMHTLDLHLSIKSQSQNNLTQFDYILFDRHYLDKKVFYELRTGKEWPRFFDSLITSNLYPQTHLYFKVDPNTAFLRLSRMRKTSDWKEGVEVLSRAPAVYEKYLSNDKASCITIDANLSENLVLNQLMSKLAGVNFR